MRPRVRRAWLLMKEHAAVECTTFAPPLLLGHESDMNEFLERSK